jgi:hypothetical protein
VRTKSLLRSFCLPAAAVATAAAAAVAGPASAASAALGTPAAGPVTPACAWYEISVTDDNQGAQDSAATYWLLEYTVQDGLQIQLDGRYPDSRYASLQNYDAAGGLFSVNGVSSALTDYQIQPDPGSINPWQYPPGQHQWGGNSFTVKLPSDVAADQVNTLPLAPAGTAAGTAGYLLYRVYLPAGGNFAQVPLPVVTFTLDGVSQQVPDCPPGAASPASAVAAQAAASTPKHLLASMPRQSPASEATGAATSAQAGAVEFARAAPAAGGLPNADSGYLTALVTPPATGDVLVIWAKAPTASPGSHPSPWPTPFSDLRYWSLCNYLVTPTVPLVANQLPDGQIDYGCRYDSEVAVDRYGYYMFVVGTEAQRPAIEGIPGATFLPFSSADPTTLHVLLLRDMLANPGFAQAVQNVPQNGSPASAATVMGPYYPRTAICPLTTLTSGGPVACLAGMAPSSAP